MSFLVKQGLLDWRQLDIYHLCMKRNHLKTSVLSPRSPGWSGACLLTSVLLTVVGVGAAVAAPSDLLKTTDWLTANLNRPDVRIVDLRYGIEYYWQAHVPGAVHLYPDALTWPENGVPSKPIPP